MKVLIRYNNNSKGNNDKWRLLIDGKEFICSHINIQASCETCTEEIFENGVRKEKHHIRPINFREIVFQIGQDDKLIALIL